MEPQPTGPLAAELKDATGTLQDALDEACGTEVGKANTGQLVRVEEILMLAAEAAKRAVSIRRRVRRDQANQVTAHATSPGTIADDDLVDTHRVFIDAVGMTWDAFAVHPSDDGTAKARLPEPYQNGWLSFDSGLERRRLSPIPADWRTMTDEALREACRRADPAPKRATPPRPIAPTGGQ